MHMFPYIILRKIMENASQEKRDETVIVKFETGRAVPKPEKANKDNIVRNETDYH